MRKFKNQSYTDFTKGENRKAMEDAIAKVESGLGKEYDLIIGGERVKAKDTFKSYNPSNKGQLIGIFQKADANLANRVIETAYKVFETWKFVLPEERSRYLFKAAEVMRRRRLELAAWMVFEVGKSWAEADADVAEAIDFLEFYGREMIRYGSPPALPQIPTEKSELEYIPLGVGIIIPPWNFPLAILCGMTSAAFVCGNTVVLKPSSDAPCIAAKFMEILEEVNLPAGVVNLLTGPGAIAGEILVAHPKARFIAFTGSREVGLRINEVAAIHRLGQKWIKRVIAEMGGKDAIIIDSEADLDSAAVGVMSSAFGYQGEKCSACSRAIVVEDVYDEFLEKLISKVKTIKVGDVKDYGNYMGGVINEKAYNSILKYIDIGKGEGRLLCGGEVAPGDGYFIKPTVIADVDSKSTIVQEEIFGPVLAVLKAKDFDDAIKIGNDTIYGLTGSVYTKNRTKIKKAKKVFHVGNLYFNRKCTGALVGSHPFGGFNMSGTDSKAGGSDYLLLFLQAKAISEKVS